MGCTTGDGEIEIGRGRGKDHQEYNSNNYPAVCSIIMSQNNT